MSGLGAIASSIIKTFEEATAAVVLGLRLALGGKRPKLVPIPVTIEPSRNRR